MFRDADIKYTIVDLIDVETYKFAEYRQTIFVAHQKLYPF